MRKGRQTQFTGIRLSRRTSRIPMRRIQLPSSGNPSRNPQSWYSYFFCNMLSTNQSHCTEPIALRLNLAVMFMAASLSAATLPTGFTETQVAAGLSNPTAMAFAPDGRLFVAQQGGALRVIKNGALLTAPFITLTTDPNGERGLLGLAFDPGFASNQFIYLYYTVPGSPAHNRVSQFKANGDVALAGSETIVMELENLSTATNHNGGAMHFGPDGKLYIAVGENANSSNSQTLANRLGKILRINANGSIPADNPFISQTIGANQSIWVIGLRNPFTFSIDSVSGRMFINDVGENTWEEINEGIAGSNYGWPTIEGYTTDVRFRGPIYAYPHSGGAVMGCAITGGALYNPGPAPYPSDYMGKYFFADYCSGWIKRFDPAVSTVVDFASGISAPVDLQVGSDGLLYYLARGIGAVYKIQFNGNQTPQITSHPQNQTAAVGQPATFTVAASGTQPLSYQWQRNGVPISGATAATYTLASASTTDNGAMFRAVVTNVFGSATSNSATLTVVSNRPPTGAITSPAAGARYSGGDTITFSGAATDPEEGILPASRYTWNVEFHHDTHTHPVLGPISGQTSGSFVVPTSGETSTNVFYRITLVVTDSGGLQHTSFRDVPPRTVNITLATSDKGLTLTLDGQPVSAPFTFPAVVGMTRSIGTASPQTLFNNKVYVFTSWSDGGAQTHTLPIPATTSTYTADFTRIRK
jgi:glucose/arabinose dehydrogenase